MIPRPIDPFFGDDATTSPPDDNFVPSTLSLTASTVAFLPDMSGDSRGDGGLVCGWFGDCDSRIALFRSARQTSTHATWYQSLSHLPKLHRMPCLSRYRVAVHTSHRVPGSCLLAANRSAASRTVTSPGLETPSSTVAKC